MRAGREPAEDVKRRLVAACQEVDLRIDNANMHLMKDVGFRIVHVGASPLDWPQDVGMLSLMANVPVSGRSRTGSSGRYGKGWIYWDRLVGHRPRLQRGKSGPPLLRFLTGLLSDTIQTR